MYRLPCCFCQRSMYLLWVSGVQWVEAFDGCARVERTHFEAVAVSKQLDHADHTDSPSCTIFRGLRSPG